jgi:hypothetical protein
MKTIYISGAITGKEDVAPAIFEKAEKDLIKKGFKVVNPMTIEDHKNHDQSWNAYMRVDLNYLLTCDSIYMLHGWELSRGARLEYAVATGLDMEVIFQRSHKTNKTGTSEV